MNETPTCKWCEVQDAIPVDTDSGIVYDVCDMCREEIEYNKWYDEQESD